MNKKDKHAIFSWITKCCKQNMISLIDIKVITMNTIYRALPFGILAVIASITSHATTGYFMHGYGVKAQGNAGTSIANFNDDIRCILSVLEYVGSLRIILQHSFCNFLCNRDN